MGQYDVFQICIRRLQRSTNIGDNKTEAAPKRAEEQLQLSFVPLL